MSSESKILEIEDIMALIPHRYPILLVDRVIEMESGKSATGLKSVTINEPFFQGHFPGLPVMPGVLIVEALAQTAAILCMSDFGEAAKDKVVYFMTISDAKFRKPVKPGDTLHLKVEIEQQRGPIAKFIGKAEVDGRVVSEARFSAMMVDR